jgi:hypothetical protein
MAFGPLCTLVTANTEVQYVRTAATAYRADNSDWPADSSVLTPFLSGSPKGPYVFDPSNGWATSGAGWAGLAFNTASQAWERAPQMCLWTPEPRRMTGWGRGTPPLC